MNIKDNKQYTDIINLLEAKHEFNIISSAFKNTSKEKVNLNLITEDDNFWIASISSFCVVNRFNMSYSFYLSKNKNMIILKSPIVFFHITAYNYFMTNHDYIRNINITLRKCFYYLIKKLNIKTASIDNVSNNGFLNFKINFCKILIESDSSIDEISNLLLTLNKFNDLIINSSYLDWENYDDAIKKVKNLLKED